MGGSMKEKMKGGGPWAPGTSKSRETACVRLVFVQVRTILNCAFCLPDPWVQLEPNKATGIKHP